MYVLSKRSLRVLIVGEFLLAVLSLIVGIASEGSLPEPLREFERSRAEGEMTTFDWVILGVVIPVLIAGLVAYVGLLLFWRPARGIYLATTVVAGLISPFLGPEVATGPAGALEDLSCIVTGVLLAVLYFSPVSELYDRRSSAA